MLSAVELDLGFFQTVLTCSCAKTITSPCPQQKKIQIKRVERCGECSVEEKKVCLWLQETLDIHIKEHNKAKVVPEEGDEVGNAV